MSDEVWQALEIVLDYIADWTIAEREHRILTQWMEDQPAERWEPVADMSAEEFRNPDAWLAGNICICHRVEVKP